MILDSGVIPTEEQLVEILDIEKIDAAFKHLPGRHPQSSHTPRLYVGGHPITSAFFNDGGSELVKDLPPDLKRTVEDALIHYGVTEEELTDLAGFSSQPSEGYTFDKLHSYFTDPDDPERQVLGLYDKRTRVVSVAPMMAYREDGEKVVLHEVGHHVATENPKYANRRAAAGFVMSQLKHKGVGPVEAIDYGLRDYSFTNDKEFLADTYLCLKAGNEVQKRNLNDAYEEIGYEEGMAGVLKQVLQANELISFEKNSVIQTVSVPVVISDRQAYETPWYYTDIRAEEQLVKLASLLGRWKHLPGRHDQKSHAPHTASYGGVDYTEHEPESTLIPGYSDLAVEAAANYIFDKRGPEPSYIDEMLDATDWGKGGRTLGDWADDMLTTIRTKRLVDQSEGVLNNKDLENMRKLDKTIWRTPKELRIIPNDKMPDYDISSASEEYGKSPHAMWLDVKPVGQWKFEGGKFVIKINADAEKIYGLSKRFVFWHELGHLTPDYEITARIGKPKDGETAAEYIDRFAGHMADE